VVVAAADWGDILTPSRGRREFSFKAAILCVCRKLSLTLRKHVAATGSEECMTESILDHMVSESVAKFQADGTGMRDYARRAAGARVLHDQ
jgi:hypothetical protein